MIRRTKKQVEDAENNVLGLKKMTEEIIWIEMTPDERKLYLMIHQTSSNEFQQILAAGTALRNSLKILDLITKCR